MSENEDDIFDDGESFESDGKTLAAQILESSKDLYFRAAAVPPK